MQRVEILRDTAATLDVIFSAGYADADNVTVTITKADGTAIVTDQAAAKDAGVTGRYTYTLAPQTDVASLTLAWSATFSGIAQTFTSFAEVVGNYLFTIDEARTFGDGALADTTAYPDTTIADARSRITEDFETICNVSFVPRYARDTLQGALGQALYLLHRRAIKLFSITVDGTALTSEDLAAVTVDDAGRLLRPTSWLTDPWPWPWNPSMIPKNIIVEYEYGYVVPPAQISRAALILARYELAANDLGERTISLTNDLGTVRLSVPGVNYPTGIPVVDAALSRYGAAAGFGVF